MIAIRLILICFFFKYSHGFLFDESEDDGKIRLTGEDNQLPARSEAEERKSSLMHSLVDLLGDSDTNSHSSRSSQGGSMVSSLISLVGGDSDKTNEESDKTESFITKGIKKLKKVLAKLLNNVGFDKIRSLYDQARDVPHLDKGVSGIFCTLRNGNLVSPEQVSRVNLSELRSFFDKDSAIAQTILKLDKAQKALAAVKEVELLLSKDDDIWTKQRDDGTGGLIHLLLKKYNTGVKGVLAVLRNRGEVEPQHFSGVNLGQLGSLFGQETEIGQTIGKLDQAQKTYDAVKQVDELLSEKSDDKNEKDGKGGLIEALLSKFNG